MFLGRYTDVGRMQNAPWNAMENRLRVAWSVPGVPPVQFPLWNGTRIIENKHISRDAFPEFVCL